MAVDPVVYWWKLARRRETSVSDHCRNTMARIGDAAPSTADAALWKSCGIDWRETRELVRNEESP